MIREGQIIELLGQKYFVLEVNYTRHYGPSVYTYTISQPEILVLRKVREESDE